jgi:hypothetical protein
MVMKPGPFFEAVESLHVSGPVVLLSPRGRRFSHADAMRYAAGETLTLLCGHYKDIDQRVADHLATEEISLGDFVLSGGEPAALAIVDATVRLLPGAMSDLDSARGDSFFERGLSAPSYTRPPSFRGHDVPEAKRARLAKIYTPDKEGRLTELPEDQMAGVFPEPGRGFAAGGAGMFSTIGDFARFGQMLLNGGELDGVRILGRKTVELMMANHLNHLARPTIGGDDAFGFGLGGRVRIDLAKGNAPGSPGQFGWSGAAATHVLIDPTEDLVAVYCTQLMGGDFAIRAEFATLLYQSIVGN